MKSYLRVSLLSLFATASCVSLASASLATFSGLIDNPSDGGSGPAIWYLDTQNPNQGSADSGLRTFTLDVEKPDFFGNPTSAMSLRTDASSGAGISGSNATSFATGTLGTVVMTFQTPDVLANGSVFSRGQFNSQPNFELFALGSGSLRVTLANQQNTVLGDLSPETWYYVAISWDLNLSDDQVSWYFGEMNNAGSPLPSGSITANEVGNSGQSIFVAGRPGTAGSNFFGSFQNIAIYDRALSSQAIEDQFSAIPEPSHFAGILGLLALLAVYRRRRGN